MIKKHIEDSIQTKQKILEDTVLIKCVEGVATAAVESIQSGGKIILAGNGGSFADAQHIGAEFTSKYLKDRRPLPALTLGCNASAMSSTGNDYGYDFVFSREIDALGNKNDIFLAFSTSGNSPNILKAIEVAIQKSIPIFGFTGKDGGKMAKICTCLHIPSTFTPVIQESHIMLGHIICALIEKKLGL